MVYVSPDPLTESTDSPDTLPVVVKSKSSVPTPVTLDVNVTVKST